MLPVYTRSNSPSALNTATSPFSAIDRIWSPTSTGDAVTSRPNSRVSHSTFPVFSSAQHATPLSHTQNSRSPFVRAHGTYATSRFVSHTFVGLPPFGSIATPYRFPPPSPKKHTTSPPAYSGEPTTRRGMSPFAHGTS